MKCEFTASLSFVDEFSSLLHTIDYIFVSVFDNHSAPLCRLEIGLYCHENKKNKVIAVTVKT